MILLDTDSYLTVNQHKHCLHRYQPHSLTRSLTTTEGYLLPKDQKTCLMASTTYNSFFVRIPRDSAYWKDQSQWMFY